MSKIYVQGEPGRVARLSPKGRYVPHDKPIATRLTPYIERRINQGDLRRVDVTGKATPRVSDADAPPFARKDESEKKAEKK